MHQIPVSRGSGSSNGASHRLFVGQDGWLAGTKTNSNSSVLFAMNPLEVWVMSCQVQPVLTSIRVMRVMSAALRGLLHCLNIISCSSLRQRLYFLRIFSIRQHIKPLLLSETTDKIIIKHIYTIPY